MRAEEIDKIIIASNSGNEQIIIWIERYIQIDGQRWGLVHFSLEANKISIDKVLKKNYEFDADMLHIELRRTLIDHSAINTFVDSIHNWKTRSALFNVQLADLFGTSISVNLEVNDSLICRDDMPILRLTFDDTKRLLVWKQIVDPSCFDIILR